MSITGSNNPFSCNPVVFSAGNSIISLGTITRVDNVFTFSVGFVWTINGTIYQNTIPFVLTITEAAAGFFRIDNALLTTSNTIELQQGLPSNSIAIRPSYPVTNILLTSWNISSDTIGNNQSPIVGSEFLKKQYDKFQVFTGTGTDVVIPLNATGFSNIYLEGAMTSIAGLDFTELLANPTSAEYPHEGKSFMLFNRSGHNITLKHSDTLQDVWFVLSKGVDLVIPNNEKVFFKCSSNVFLEVDKSWSTSDEIIGLTTALSLKADLVAGKVPSSQLPSYVDDVLEYANLATFPVSGEASKIYLALDTNFTYRWTGSVYVKISDTGKLDKVSTVDVEKVYIKNADGTQSMKPTSELGGSSVQSVSGDSVDNTNPLNPIINAIPLSGTTVGNPVTGDIEIKGTDYHIGKIFQSDHVNELNFSLEFNTDLPYFGLKMESFDSLRFNLIDITSDMQFITSNDWLLVGSKDTILGGRGITGAQDYTPNIKDLDYTQKKYVDNLVNIATNTATVTVELVNSLFTDFYAPDDLRINTTNKIFGVGTITLKVNDVAYTLTDLIIKGDKITVETNSESVFNLNIIYE